MLVSCKRMKLQYPMYVNEPLCSTFAVIRIEIYTNRSMYASRYNIRRVEYKTKACKGMLVQQEMRIWNEKKRNKTYETVQISIVE